MTVLKQYDIYDIYFFHTGEFDQNVLLIFFPLYIFWCVGQNVTNFRPAGCISARINVMHYVMLRHFCKIHGIRNKQAGWQKRITFFSNLTQTVLVHWIIVRDFKYEITTFWPISNHSFRPFILIWSIASRFTSTVKFLMSQDFHTKCIFQKIHHWWTIPNF